MCKEFIILNGELKTLNKGSLINSDPLRTKNAFIDERQMMRVATRIQIPEIDYEERKTLVLAAMNEQLKAFVKNCENPLGWKN